MWLYALKILQNFYVFPMYREIWKSTNKINAKYCCLEKISAECSQNITNKLLSWKGHGVRYKKVTKFLLRVTKFFYVLDFGVSLKQLFLGFRFLVFLYENFWKVLGLCSFGFVIHLVNKIWFSAIYDPTYKGNQLKI